MRYLSFGLAVMLISAAVQAEAQLNEQFSYSDGPLMTVSGGAWFHEWDGLDDPIVSSGMATMGTGPTHYSDGERNFNGVLGASGDSATFSFDFGTVNTTWTDEAYSFWLSPWNATDGQLFDQSVEFVFGSGVGARDTMRFYSLEDFQNTRELGRIPMGQMLHFSGAMTRVGDSVNYTIAVNGTDMGSGSFSLIGSNSLNNTEIYGGGNTGTFEGNFDNLTLEPVPEPTSILCVLAGTAYLFRRGRRQQ